MRTTAGISSRTVATYGATTNEILRLRRDLEAASVTVVVMEATGDYWKPFYFLLAESLNVQLVNAPPAGGRRRSTQKHIRDATSSSEDSVNLRTGGA
jgi:transposase